MELSGQPSTGAAQRRKQRRLRSWSRHEQQSIAAALATSLHHSALRGQKKARAGEWGSEMNYTAKTWRTPTLQPELVSLFDEESGGSRPPCLGEPREKQERVQPQIMEQLADVVPWFGFWTSDRSLAGSTALQRGFLLRTVSSNLQQQIGLGTRNCRRTVRR